MTDIVERLRAEGNEKAAREIERLRLDEIMEQSNGELEDLWALECSVARHSARQNGGDHG